MEGKHKKYQNGGYNPFTGIDTSGVTGGFDEFNNPIAGMIPGGGAIAGLGQVAGGVADIFGSKKEIERQRRKRQGAKGRRQEARSALDSFDFDVSQAQRDLATAGIRPTDTSYIQSSLAASLNSMNDPRQFGNVNNLLGQTLEAERKAKEGDLNRELGAMGNLANLEQRALQQKQGLELGLLQSDRQLAMDDQMQASRNIEAARARKRDAFGNIAGGLANVGMAFAGLPGGAPVGGDTEKDIPFMGGISEKGGRVKYEEGGTMNEDVMMRILKEQRPVQKTEGEFNHDTNKKAIIDEETGVKEGEATGGEYILNPEQGEAIKSQYDAITQMIDSGDEPSLEELQSLYDAVHEVFSQPQFNEA